jgi:hypothetical protein
MSYVGNTPTQQAFTPAIDYFSGNASTTAFTLSKPVASVAQVQVVVNNVAQNPASAYTVSSNTITFTSAPSSGTNNIYVYYTSPITQVIAPGQGTVQTTQLGNITNIASGNSNLTLQTGSTPTTAVTIDTSQNVGIGTSSPSRKLVVSNAGAAGFEFGAGVGVGSGNEVLNYNRSTSLYIPSFAYASTHTFYAGTAGGTRAVDIDSSGRLLVGGSTAIAPFTVFTAAGSYGQIAAYSVTSSDVSSAGISITKYDNVTTTSQVFQRFLVNQAATASGQINANGASAAAFGSYSDRRLKENITDLPSQLANIMALRTVEFDYIESEGGGHQIGFVAQEVQEVYPDLVGEREDGMLTLTDLNKNDARLIKAIQEQQALITALTARIEALENK